METSRYRETGESKQSKVASKKYAGVLQITGLD